MTNSSGGFGDSVDALASHQEKSNGVGKYPFWHYWEIH